jgi:hypothetical protein
MKIFFTYCLLLFLFSCSKKEKDKAVIMKTLTDYPYATQLIVLDTNFNMVDSIPLFNYSAKRIPKNIKQDIESITQVQDSSKLVLLGSGSLSPFRDSAYMIDINNRRKEAKDLTGLLKIVNQQGIRELNLEGAVRDGHEYILANRGNLNWRKNHLIFTLSLFFPEPGMVAIIPVRSIDDSSSFQGISGLAYGSINDALVMTASTEQTTNSFEDGAIGKSYIWIIKKLFSTVGKAELSPEIVIDLERIDPIFKGQKIESVTILEESNGFVRLVLVADNDNGSSSIFKLSIKIN